MSFTREDFTIKKDILAYSRMRQLLNDAIQVKDITIINFDDFSSAENFNEAQTLCSEIVAKLHEVGKLEDFIDYGFINENPDKRLSVDNLDIEVVVALAYDFFTSTGSNLIRSMQIKKRELEKAKSMDISVIQEIVKQMDSLGIQMPENK